MVNRSKNPIINSPLTTCRVGKSSLAKVKICETDRINVHPV